MTDERDLEAEITQLKAAVDAAARNRIKAEHLRDTAQAQADALRARLRDDFGCADLDQARTLLGTLETALAQRIDQLKTALTEAGAR